jgi:hypothetical protein
MRSGPLLEDRSAIPWPLRVIHGEEEGYRCTNQAPWNCLGDMQRGQKSLGAGASDSSVHALMGILRDAMRMTLRGEVDWRLYPPARDRQPALLAYPLRARLKPLPPLEKPTSRPPHPR